MPASSQFILGYGSLIESQSRRVTSPFASHAVPVNVVGIRRGWFGRIDEVGFSPTYLAAVFDPDSNCNGVIFKASQEELEKFDANEPGYRRERVDQANITMLDGNESAPRGDIWFYAVTEKQLASAESPILLSYLDVCLRGCLEVEADYPLAREASFAETFLKTSTDWSEFWVNDRVNPMWASTDPSNTNEIDQLLQKVLGEELISKIKMGVDI